MDDDIRCQVHLNIGRAYLGEGKCAEARAEFSTLLQLKQSLDEQAIAYLYIGQSYFVERKFKLCRAELAKVIEMDPSHRPTEEQHIVNSAKGSAQLMIADSYFEEGNNLQAKEEYNKLLLIKNLTQEARAKAENQLKLITEIEQKSKDQR